MKDCCTYSYLRMFNYKGRLQNYFTEIFLSYRSPISEIKKTHLRNVDQEECHLLGCGAMWEL
jgi:hypothetical protein